MFEIFNTILLLQLYKNQVIIFQISESITSWSEVFHYSYL